MPSQYRKVKEETIIIKTEVNMSLFTENLNIYKEIIKIDKWVYQKNCFLISILTENKILMIKFWIK